MENTPINNQTKKRPDRHGANNPMAGRKHKDSTKELMRQKALQRNQEYKKWKDSQHHITMDEFLSNNPVAEQFIRKMIKEQIDKFVWKECQKKQSTPNIWL